MVRPLMKGQFRNVGFFIGAVIIMIIACIKAFSFAETLEADFFIDLHTEQYFKPEYQEIYQLEQELAEQTLDKLEREQEKERETPSDWNK